MGLYTSLNFSQYYDEPKKEVKEPINNKQYKTKVVSINKNSRRSLYSEAQQILKKSKKLNGVDFKKQYREGQYVVVFDINGPILTKKGRIIEIIAENLMYVEMEDTYKDVNDNYLVAFVTHENKVIPL